MLLTIMAAVEGEERTNRQEIKLYGEGHEDDEAAHGLNRLLKWVMNQCGGEFALSDQFRSGAAVGEGWVTVDVDYFDDPDGLIKLVFVDDDEMFDDPLAKDPTSADSRYVHRVKMMADDEIEARWPGAKEKLHTRAFAAEAGPETDGSGSRDIYLTANDPKSPKVYDAQKKLWAVLETWWTQIEPGWVVVDEATGLLVEKTNEELEAMKMARAEEQRGFLRKLVDGSAAAEFNMASLAAEGAGLPPPPKPEMPKPLQAKQRPIKRVYQAFTSYECLLEKMASPLKELKRPPYVAFRALHDKVKGEWFGLLRPLMDPQRQHNVEQSAIVQLMQLMPKASWMGPKGVFHNKQEWEQKVAKPGQMLEYNASRGKPEQIRTPDIPRHLIDMALSRPQAMREICGVNVEMTGQRQGQDAGVVMEMRSKAAKTVLAPIFDNNRRSKKELGKVLLSFIQTYVSRGRRIRVLGEEGTQYVEMTEQMQLGRYDLVVEETNATLNDRIGTLNIMQTTLPSLLKEGVPIPAEFVDLLPMAPHIRDAMKRMVAWHNLSNGLEPPVGWQPGMPDPRTLPPPGEPVAPL
ncbi:MAG TPA: hypothetical protein VGR19_11055, partial [Allosphingosinicella sp.]|nr:hypothetical protein [Allosphingosinicella sp.]